MPFYEFFEIGYCRIWNDLKGQYVLMILYGTRGSGDRYSNLPVSSYQRLEGLETSK